MRALIALVLLALLFVLGELVYNASLYLFTVIRERNR